MDWQESNGVLVASVVYVMMNQKYHTSRNVRTQWFFKHLNTKLSFSPRSSIFQFKEENEIEIISIYPQDPPLLWGPETSHLYQYLITTETNIVFLSNSSKAVYCLDMSPSISAVDIQRGEVMIDEIISAIRNSIEGVVRPFVVPGSKLIFEPDVFVTVIVHTPFFTTPAQQVLVQGWRVTATNVDEFLSAIIKQLELLENTIADVSGLVHDQIDSVRMKQADSEMLVGGLFEELSEKPCITSSNLSMVGPDLGFINLLRYGMLALRLLPPTNLSNLVVVTDGMITLPDIDVLDSVLSQLRSNAVAVSFFHVGSQFHPHCCQGLVPYSELMQFITAATLGAYVPSPPITEKSSLINIYHEIFVTWSFRKRVGIGDLTTPMPKDGDWNISNQSFYGNRETQLLIKKQTEETLNASLTSVLFCRLHEGYIIKNVHLKDNELEVSLVLPWSNHIFIEYFVTAQWPESNHANMVHYVLSIKAPYEFLHDVTCLMKKRFHSPYRQAVVSRFWATLKTLSHTDLLLPRLDSFSRSSSAYTLPDSIRSGMPLFYLPSNAAPPVLSSSSTGCPQFAQFWRPIVMLEPSVWQKWFHTHRLGVILQPDRPLPYSPHVMSNSTRVQVLQCRQAAATLFNTLKSLSSFVLIENHSYIKIIPPREGDKGPNWFSIIRVTSKPPCAVIHIAFLGGTPGKVRHQVIEQIREDISNLKLPQRCDFVKKYESPLEVNVRPEVECCMLLQKPLEKILIRYERMPCEFRTVVFPDGTQPISAAKPLRPTTTLITTLSRYLHHKRSIWDAQTPSASHNNTLPVMLTTLTKMRLQEGFRFAHCTAGIINMVLEVQMKCYDDNDDINENAGKYQPCIIQYVLFPPHVTNSSAKGSNSGDEAMDDLETEIRTELITECWIEPQHGVVTNSPPNRLYMDNLQYHQIADMMWQVDVECISNLLTFDHLQLMCHNQQIMPPLSLDPSSIHQNPLENWPHAVALEDKRIHRIPFAYNLMNILPKCQQAEILSSTFIQELGEWENSSGYDGPNNLLMESLLSQLQEIHHRELHLSDHESNYLIQLIMARTRDVVLHPVPYPNGNSVSETRKVSDTESSDTCETIPAASDWARMISWATYSAEMSSPIQVGSPDDQRNSKPPSKLPSWTNRKHCSVIPKWKCFIKSMASTHCVLTFIPASFHDLKILMLGAEPKMFKAVHLDYSDPSQDMEPKLILNSNLNPDTESFNPMDSNAQLSQNKSCSISSSRGWFVGSEDDLVFDPVANKKDIFKEFCKDLETQSPFRVRSSSWDTVKKHSEHTKIISHRNRTSSVGSKMKNTAEYKKDISFCDEQSVTSFSTPCSMTKKVLGSLTLPTYIYDCPLSYLVDALIFKSNFERKAADIFQDKRINEKDDSKVEEVSNADELDLRHHCKLVTEAFTKCFVTSVFKSLHVGHKVSPLDIQLAVNECDKTLLKLDITNYIRTVCGHFNNLASKDEIPNGLSSLLNSACLSHEVTPLHGLIKKRFMEILTVCFKPISSKPEYFFCCPPFHLSRLVDTSSDHNRAEGTDFDMMTLQSDVLDLHNNPDNIIGGWERVGFTTTPDDARTSLLSNMDSESISDFPDDDIGDDIAPLFLHLVCSLQSPKDNFIYNCPGKDLPTCLGEFVDDPKLFEDKDIWDFIFSLDMYFLTLPSNSLIESGTKEESKHYPDNMSPCPQTDHNYYEDTEQQWADGLNERLKHLSVQQQKAITLCITEIKWLMQDEIAVFLLEKSPATEEALNFVANHVESSVGRYSCILNILHLDFVYGIDQSLTKFLQELGRIKVDNYYLKREADFYYLSKEEELSAGPKNNGAELVNDFGNLQTDYYDNGYQWIIDINQHRMKMPNFWLILKIEKEVVTCHFHCRFLEINCKEVRNYRHIHSRVLECIETVCKTVNQTLLLESLHDTRMCDPLLEPETSDDIWNSNQMTLNRTKSFEDGIDTDEKNNLKSTSKFLPGCFSCPVVWQTHFVLHPRLKTGPGKPGLSRAIQALRTVLNRFSVNNRTNMFVYQDSSGNNVFYLRLHENIRCSIKPTVIEEENSPGSVSRSSSINSLNNKKPHDDNSLKEVRPRLKSFGESIEKDCSKQEDFLTLKVHGITDAGAEVKNELVQVLQNRLDDAVLEVLSVMLARNPMCKLSPDDVYFIQKPNYYPDNIFQFTVPKSVLNHLEALAYYLRQNLLQFLFLPKYIDSRHQFQDYSQPDIAKRMGDLNIYLYNQSPVSGSKGIACLGIALVEKNGLIVNQTDFTKNKRSFENKNINKLNFEIFTKTEMYAHDYNKYESCPDTCIEIRLWKQGRVNMESLIQKLKQAIQYSFWDFATEFHLLTAPLNESCSGSPSVTLHNIYYNVIPDWFQYGNDLNVPSIRMHTFSLTSRHAVAITLNEVHTLVQSHESSAFLFYENFEKTRALVYQSEFEIPSSGRCFLIACNPALCKILLDSEMPGSAESSDSKVLKANQKFSPFYHTSDGMLQCIPRQRFLIVIINNNEVSLYTYNWAKDKVENLIKSLTNLGYWLSARSNFLTGILSQKLGLFHNQPFMRKFIPQWNTAEGTELESLLVFSPAGMPKKSSIGTLSTMTDILRDRKPLCWRKTVSDPVVVNVQQLIDIHEYDKEEKRRKLLLMWPNRGNASFIPLTEETLRLFIQYSRVIHYCLTPLLFLPQWRLQSAATRDHSLKVNYSQTQVSSLQSQENIDENWHQALCANFINEYQQYLHTLGFISVQTSENSLQNVDEFEKGSMVKPIYYLQKSLLGGVLIFEILLSEPFFHAKIHALECSRLQVANSSSLISQFMLSFLDECDKVKVVMHLHSFTYDYHLRCLHWFISDRQCLLKSDYHLTSFLDDFLKYYPKAPNYARSLAYTGIMSVPDLITPASQLFDYLLSHSCDYEMDVLRMLPMNVSNNDIVPLETEYILVKIGSTSHLANRELLDIKQTDDFDVTLIISYQETNSPTTITLKYYVLLTSRRELYPKLEIERKLGKFCAVSTADPLVMYAENDHSIVNVDDEPTSTTPDSSCEIRQESVNYVGYYSSHEQSMQQLMLEEVSNVQWHIESMLGKGALDCRTHFLWNKLLSTSPMQSLTYSELFELKDLAIVQNLLCLDSRLGGMLSQSVTWYQGLMKILMTKYADRHRIFVSPDNNIHHLLILHPRFLNGFVMLTIDFNSSVGDLSIVHRRCPNPEGDITASDMHCLVEGVVNACCFHLWISLL